MTNENDMKFKLFHKQGFIETQVCPLVYMLSMVTFKLQCQS